MCAPTPTACSIVETPVRPLQGASASGEGNLECTFNSVQLPATCKHVVLTACVYKTSLLCATLSAQCCHMCLRVDACRQAFAASGSMRDAASFLFYFPRRFEDVKVLMYREVGLWCAVLCCAMPCLALHWMLWQPHVMLSSCCGTVFVWAVAPSGVAPLCLCIFIVDRMMSACTFGMALC